MWFVSFSYIFGLKKCTQIRWSFHEAISHPYTLSRIPMCPTCSQLQMLRWGSLSNLVMLLPHGLEGQARDSRIVGLGVGQEVSCHDIWFIYKQGFPWNIWKKFTFWAKKMMFHEFLRSCYWMCMECDWCEATFYLDDSSIWVDELCSCQAGIIQQKPTKFSKHHRPGRKNIMCSWESLESVGKSKLTVSHDS